MFIIPSRSSRSASSVSACAGVQVAVPDPIPLDPARDVPLDTLGSTWIVAAGPSAPGQPDYKGAPLCQKPAILWPLVIS